ncbi:PH domain-like protein [Periconia macrospinosa]|uniref:PH domain-like protein n=1 Tax=Periconia macrospinosa TaxID=97972 RepID=A0A2V1EAW9_9PLEO|nr:PH domain-like protein [Periconia macrospinosa]
MAPNRSKARAQQPQPPPNPPDYGPDVPTNMDATFLPPRSNEELNLSVIRRHYPEVIAVHYVVSYAALYIYGLDPPGWERTGTEGSLFVCQLAPSLQGVERFSVIMLNRKGLENFTMEIKSPDDIEFGEFIMMQSDQNQVYGLWIMNDPPPSSTANARTELQERLEELAKRAQGSREAFEKMRENGPSTHEQTETSIAMGRQLSLRELFGQPRPEQYAHIDVHTTNQGAAHSDVTTIPQSNVQSDVLSQLFMKAKQDYNGMG